MINKIIELIKKHKVITGLVVLMIGYFIYESTLTKTTQTSTETNKNNVVPFPTQIVLQSTSEPFDLTDSDPNYPLLPFLPYNGQNFKVTRYIAPLKLEVEIKNEAAIETVEPKLKEWLRNKELIEGENTIIWKYTGQN